ncbi:MAG: succinate dehydrogenase cytochrome b subunit [Acidobacteria bacterium]|nr:succinate dehydrogenase cytochrome b subunit [Acidobacteriota bacterium]
MKTLKLIFLSSLGRKYVMAISGALLFLFVIGHMLGNLQIFLGKDFLNAYAHFLKATPELLWPARIGLLVLAILHIVTAVQLAIENRRARPLAYDGTKIYAASFAAQAILFSGLVVLAFIVYHLLHFTFGKIQPEALTYTVMYKGEPIHDVYKMMVMGFSNPWISAIYLICMGLLCLHLSHGVSSLFQSLGWKTNAYRNAIDKFAKISALIIFLGNCAIPVAILLGLVK